jgi:predicted permease
LVENLVLAVIGGSLAILLASWTTAILVHMLPAQSGLQLAFSASPDARVMTFTLLLSLASGVLFGLVPAFSAARSDVVPALKNQAAGVLGSGGQARFRRVLVAAQVGLCLLLLVGAGLFARSLYNLQNLNLGFRSDHLLTFRIDPKLNVYTSKQIFSLYDRLLTALAAQAGVRSVTCSRVALLAFDEAGQDIQIPGYRPREGEEIVPDMNSVGPGYFSTLGIPMIAGREFTSQDAGGDVPKVAVVNEQFARRYFGNPSVVGRVLVLGPNHNVEIIGVCRDAKYASVREKTREFVYLPYLEGRDPGGMTIYLRTLLDPFRLAPAVRQEVRRLDANLPVSNLETMADQIDDNLFLDRIVAALSVSFGLLATVLAAVGLYGVLSYAVARRTREIGIRMALGATRERVMRMVMGEVALLAGSGMAVAIPVALALTRLIKSRLFGLATNDPQTFAGAVIVLGVVAALAGYVPARRATRVDPISALRYE